MAFTERDTYALGVEFLCIGLVHLIGGHGTVYAASTIGGRISDFALAATIAMSLYIILIQLRAAEAFRNMVQLPTHSSGSMMQIRMRVRYVLDFMQSTGAFPIMFGLWILLPSGVITRSQFYSAIAFIFGGAGIRSAFGNILDRINTLVRVDELQQKAGGNNDAKIRRRKILKKEARYLMLNMVTDLLILVFAPISWVIFGSVTSSTQWLLHHGTNETITAILVFVLCIVTHKQVSSDCAKKRRREKKVGLVTKFTKPSSGQPSGASDGEPVYTVANESGMSVVMDSEIEFGRKKRGKSIKGEVGGLFEDLES